VIEKTRIVIVDDHPIVQDAIESKLSSRDDIELVAKGETGEDVIRLVKEYEPDILILDLRMPQTNSGSSQQSFQAIPTIYQISESYPHTKIIIFTSYLIPALVQEVVRGKIKGYLLKRDKLSRKLLTAVDMVMMGSVFVSETISDNLGGSEPISSEQIKLNPRPLEALRRLFADPDLSTAQHAANMGISKSTFKQHLSAAYRALGVQDRTAAMVRALNLGLFDHEDYHE